jgi:hypothetical protein
MRDDSELRERLLTLYGSGPDPVSADEVINRVTKGDTLSASAWAPRRPQTPRRSAWAWLVIVVALIVVLVVAVRIESGPSNTRPVSPVANQVDLDVTPRGWAPVDFGNAQISVPNTWNIGEACGNQAGVFLQDLGGEQFPCSNSATYVSVLSATKAPVKKSRTVNGIKVYVSNESRTQVTAWAPTLGVELDLNAKGLNPRILDTLTYSPRSVVLASGSAPLIPASWRNVSFGGLSFAVPQNWPTTRIDDPNIGCGPPLLSISLPSSVTFDSGTEDAAMGCPGPVFPPAGDSDDGLAIDPGPYGPFYENEPTGACLHINALTACPTSDHAFGVLVLAVHLPGRDQPVAVEIGLAGSGLIARTILYSIQLSEQSPPTTMTTVRAAPTTTTGVRTSAPPATSTTRPPSTTTTEKPPPTTSTTISDIGPHDLQSVAGCTSHPNLTVQLTWSAGSTGDSETVEEEDGSTWSTVAVVPPGTTTYTVTPVPAYTYLTFRVLAGGYTSNLTTTQTFPVC